MYGTPDGRKTLSASITYGNAAPDLAQALPKALDDLLKEVFCGGQAPRELSLTRRGGRRCRGEAGAGSSGSG